VDIASFFGTLFFANRTGYIRYAIAGPVNFSNNTQNKTFFARSTRLLFQPHAETDA
jgi:hypothetical protein